MLSGAISLLFLNRVVLKGLLRLCNLILLLSHNKIIGSLKTLGSVVGYAVPN